MARVPAADADLTLAVDFCNTYDLLEEPPDRLSLDLLTRLGRHHGRPDLVSGFHAADLPGLRDLRSALYRVFEAGTPAAKATAVNAVLTGTSARAVVVDGPDGDLRLVAAGGPAPLDVLGATLGGAVAAALVDGGAVRLRLCRADPCRCVYVDRTRANRQRYCCELCNDRMASAAYRRRR